MKKLYILLTILTLTAMIVLSGCTTEDTENDTSVTSVSEERTEEKEIEELAVYRKLSPSEAKDLMVEGNIILDVRTLAEYNEGYIPGALLHPLAEIQNSNFEPLPDKDQIILVYCRSGNRSRQASELLIKAGYTEVYDFGGIRDWPYETEKP